MVVAESRYLAEDAAADIVVDVEPLPAVVDLEAALAPGAPLRPRRPRLATSPRTCASARATTRRRAPRADRRDRAPLPLRPRQPRRRSRTAAWSAQWDARAEQLTVWDTTQAPIPIRNGLAAMLGPVRAQVRVVAPFIGGGFGPKIMMFYPEEVLVPWAGDAPRPAGEVDRGPRGELLRHHPGARPDPRRRDGARRATAASSASATSSCTTPAPTTPTASPCRSTASARCSAPTTCRPTTASSRAVFTNKPIVTPYRGAGRQHGVFVMERLLDLAARELGIDRVEIRRRNFLPPDAFPLRPRDHLPGLHAARLRQRQLRAGARAGGAS